MAMCWERLDTSTSGGSIASGTFHFIFIASAERFFRLFQYFRGQQVGMDEAGTMIVNPEMEVAATSRLNLTLAGTT